MTDQFAALNGSRLTKVSLHVPNRGVWYAQCEFESAPVLRPGKCTLQLGSLSLVGTVEPKYAGDFAEQKRLVLVGGSGMWGNTIVTPRAYHNDAGVKALLIAQDVAREAGETLGNFAPENERVGVDFVRAGSWPASRVLEDAIGDVLWWVDFAGVTQVGERPTAPALLDTDYRVLEFDPRAQVAQLSVSDPAVLAIGSVLTSPALAGSLVVREYAVQVDATGVRIVAWCGGGELSAGRLAELIRRLTVRVADAPLLGLYRYRVVNMAVDGRVSLQSVRRDVGLPDIEPISQWPGVAGAHAVLTPGAEVLVAFVEGDAAQPIVTHYAGKDAPGFVPVSLTLGGSAGSAAARQNDTVEVLLPPAIFTGTIGGVPATGVITFPLTTTLGQITTGSSKVKIAT